MAVCSGCSTVGACTCTLTVMDTATLDLTLTGTGSAGDPWVLSGEAAGGGGGACAQTKTNYTVSTTASVLSVTFGTDVGTPEPFRSCADFIGDGVDDAIAIQAAIDAAAAPVMFGQPVTEVILLPGYYQLGSTIDLKGVPLRGTDMNQTVLVNMTASYGRVFENSGFNGSLKDFLLFFFVGIGGSFYFHTNASFVATTGTFALLVERLHMVVFSSGLGADSGYFEFPNPLSDIIFNDTVLRAGLGAFERGISCVGGIPAQIQVNIRGCSFYNVVVRLDFIPNVIISDSRFEGDSTQIFQYGVDLRPQLSNRGYGGINNCQFFGRGINLEGGVVGWTVTNNRFHVAGYSPLDNPVIPATIRLAAGTIGADHNIISDNNIFAAFRNGILVEGLPGLTISTMIHDNVITNYSQTATGFAGILLQNNCDRNSVQGNKCDSYGINANGIVILTADCADNFVTNNDLAKFLAPGTPLIDNGTNTVVAAGNRIVP